MSRRGQIQMTDDEVRSFLGEERTVICATNGVRGLPHLMPLWYVVRDTGPDGAPELWAWTFGKSQKIKNLERDPRATLQVEAGTEYHLLRGVMLETDVELVRDVDAVTQLGLEITARYGGDLAASSDEARQLIAAQAAKRVAMRFVETRRATWDHRKLGGVY
ncbi:pyridoxamine 5'-phosphate oxidase [Conexibacter sp. W3-3-2]|uniref:pyridoxamine 5'-phosphate oxidase family protein n=1 Tax=Conexibacter sp. W3-3-2 TaxID=2675227 RepID=UPI0012B92A60|nr:pyridoxamine 5'-phosphate oxidase family protein [Conexibacter sp. W3-3-2]MTD45795.1 pyridoxamine 5'-phosphate oxidase [Conexibacter sp. W3-3-2]